jgi:hypothetical protein
MGELGSGVIHFEAPSVEGAIFFDDTGLVTGTFQDRKQVTSGASAVDLIVETSLKRNFLVSVYALDPEMIHYWVNLPNAEVLHKNLSTEFTDLGGLAKKMRAEKLTGYIDVSIKGGDARGMIFFNFGNIIGGSYSWEKGKLDGSRTSLSRLTIETREKGGAFTVYRISLHQHPEKKETKKPPLSGPDELIITMIQQMLIVLENAIGSNKKIKHNFNTLLKKKFAEKTNEYAFLDPFAAEFDYRSGNLKFTGTASAEQFVKGTVESLGEISREIGIDNDFKRDLNSWKKRYSAEINRFNIRL